MGRRALLLGLLLGLSVAACSTTESADRNGSNDPTNPSGTAVGATGDESAGLPDGEDRVVERIVDGDTIWVDGAERVRLIGIDTPETKDPRKPVQCFGEEATRYITDLIEPGTAVRLVYDVERLDRYDRTLAYVYRLADGLFVNAALVRDGYAFAYTYPPNVAHSDEFVALQRDAREAGKGLWSACPVEE